MDKQELKPKDSEKELENKNEPQPAATEKPTLAQADEEETESPGLPNIQAKDWKKFIGCGG